MCTRQSVKCVVVRIFSIVTRKIKKTYTNIYTYIYIHHQQKRRQQQQHHHPSSFGTNANTPMLFIHNIYNCIYYWHCVPLAHSVLYTVWTMETVDVFSASGEKHPHFTFNSGSYHMCTHCLVFRIAYKHSSLHHLHGKCFPLLLLPKIKKINQI